jgi:DNA polymerase III sliding clamp (beta) subunit (PCNA family)
MKIQRGDLLAKLNEASPGLTSTQALTVEQSDCFVFIKDTLYSFNDSIMVRVPNPLPGLDVVVNGRDLLDLVAKVPDDELEVELGDGELRVNGTGRSAWISAAVDVAMPLNEVPVPSKWSKLSEGTAKALQQAASTCDAKSSDYLVTAIHVTPDLVEGTDQIRFMRVSGPTGFQSRALLPADAVYELKKVELNKVSVGEGWVHFKTGQSAVVSMRCGHGDYIEGVEEALKLKKPEKVVLPVGLKDTVERCEIFDHKQGDFKIGVKLSDGRLVLTASNEGGGYKERHKMEYGGRPLNFMVAPDLLVEVLSHTREVMVDGTKMKIAWDQSVFVVCLDASEDEQ